MRVGITGHQELSRPEGWTEIRRLLREHLRTIHDPLIGITSLAVGADQLFAEEVLRRRGQLRVVLPFPGYESRIAPESRVEYQRLLDHAVSTTVLSRVGSDEESYLAAGRFIVANSDELIAIWDGRGAQGLGGTGDVVDYASRHHRPVHHIDASPWRDAPQT